MGRYTPAGQKRTLAGWTLLLTCHTAICKQQLPSSGLAYLFLAWHLPHIHCATSTFATSTFATRTLRSMSRLAPAMLPASVARFLLLTCFVGQVRADWYLGSAGVSCVSACAALNPAQYCTDSALLSAFNSDCSSKADAASTISSVESSLSEDICPTTAIPFDGDTGSRPVVEDDLSRCRTRTEIDYAPLCSAEPGSNWRRLCWCLTPPSPPPLPATWTFAGPGHSAPISLSHYSHLATHQRQRQLHFQAWFHHHHYPAD